MKLSKKVQRILMASAAVLMLGTGQALAADTPFGDCTGAVGTDCTATTGHASMSVTSTLSVNEMRAVSFGNFAVSTPAAGDKVILGLDASRTVTGAFTPLNGADGNATGGANPSPLETGAQSPGHFTISGGDESASTEIYISFADNTGAVIDMCDSAETNCDDYHQGNAVSLGDGLTLDHFFINQSGSDVYGHYINKTAGGVAPGISDPWLPGGAAHAGGKSDGATDGEVDVVVGGRLISQAGGLLTVGKHTGTFNIMASY